MNWIYNVTYVFTYFETSSGYYISHPIYRRVTKSLRALAERSSGLQDDENVSPDEGANLRRMTSRETFPGKRWWYFAAIFIRESEAPAAYAPCRAHLQDEGSRFRARTRRGRGPGDGNFPAAENANEISLIQADSRLGSLYRRFAIQLNPFTGLYGGKAPRWIRVYISRLLIRFADRT